MQNPWLITRCQASGPSELRALSLTEQGSIKQCKTFTESIPVLWEWRPGQGGYSAGKQRIDSQVRQSFLSHPWTVRRHRSANRRSGQRFTGIEPFQTTFIPSPPRLFDNIWRRTQDQLTLFKNKTVAVNHWIHNLWQLIFFYKKKIYIFFFIKTCKISSANMGFGSANIQRNYTVQQLIAQLRQHAENSFFPWFILSYNKLNITQLVV